MKQVYIKWKCRQNNRTVFRNPPVVHQVSLRDAMLESGLL